MPQVNWDSNIDGDIQSHTKDTFDSDDHAHSYAQGLVDLLPAVDAATVITDTYIQVHTK